jgi:heptosyltransferase-3
MKQRPQRFLIIKFQHIGDVLLTSPLVSALKRENPAAYISVAVKAGTEAMLAGHPDLAGLYILPEHKTGEPSLSFFLRYARWIYQLRKKRFDIVVNTTKGDHGILVAWLSGAPKVIGLVNKKNIGKGIYRFIDIPITPPPQPIHTVLRNLCLIKDLTRLQNLSVTIDLRSGNIEKTKNILSQLGLDLSRPFVHIHPTSRWMFKCWPNKFMAETIDWLMLQGLQVVLTASPAEKELVRIEEILHQCASDPINLAGKLTLKQTAIISSLAAFFFGVDTAPMHIAAAVNTPVVGLFGPSGATNWGPWPNPQTQELLQAKNPYPNRNGIQSAGPHTVIQKKWGCVPCQQSGCERRKRSACLDTLLPETVIPVLQKQIETSRKVRNAP